MLNLSGDSGKSLHPRLLLHSGGANTVSLILYHKAIDTICRSMENVKRAKSIFKYQVNIHWLTCEETFHIKSMLYFSRVKISSKERVVPVTKENKLKSHTELQKTPQEGQTPRRAHFMYSLI